MIDEILKICNNKTNRRNILKALEKERICNFDVMDDHGRVYYITIRDETPYINYKSLNIDEDLVLENQQLKERIKELESKEEYIDLNDYKIEESPMISLAKKYIEKCKNKE